jgi:hypothetical protein
MFGKIASFLRFFMKIPDPKKGGKKSIKRDRI